ncbi:helix-hairpin-helix domain-containing protein [Candidatus Epulonipiscium viviparus]|uniref:helix-hairpin-helix domain-containing protein n=1 Tax=Candidatus Epulonipiscium viviparus TaxID=420336 RepID=UPI00016BFF02|nr:helix-hairpin-helix domain-containing protein [Candidatus Epulopiscium viviparus]
MKEKYKGIALFAGLAGCISGFALYNNNDDQIIMPSQHETAISMLHEIDQMKTIDTNQTHATNISTTPPAPSIIPIHIDGEVINPGVYNIAEGELINDLVVMAGGLTNDADLATINLAATVTTNSKVYIPAFDDEVPVMTQATISSIASQSDDGLIHINTATLAELDSLPGIGPVKATSILSYIEQNGEFTDINEILDVSGIGDATLDNIKDLITIN